MKPDQVSSDLMSLADRVSRYGTAVISHPYQLEMPEWTGAGVSIRSSPLGAEPSSLAGFGTPFVVTTVHARAFTWLLLELRDVLGDRLDYLNKLEFYGMVAEAAQRHIAANPSEAEDPRPILFAAFAEALQWNYAPCPNSTIAGDSNAEDSTSHRETPSSGSDSEGELFGRN